MSRKIILDGIILILVFGMIWLFFSYYLKPATLPTTFISKENEIRIGEWLEKEIIEHYGVVDSNKWEKNIDEVMDRILAVPELKEKNYSVVVLNSHEINAFATLGKTIYFFRGLMEEIDNPEQFAGILAHEIGHVEKNHVQEKLIAEFGMNLLLSVISGGDPILAGQLMKEFISGTFSRKKEEEADLFALKVMHEAGINPVHLGIVFKKLKNLHDNQSVIQLEILHSHPDINKRIRKSFEYKKENFVEEKFTNSWPEED